MLFVKDALFIDASVAEMAPNIDVLAEIFKILTYFQEQHGERIARELGLLPGTLPQVDMSGIRASFGLSEEVDQLTHRELQQRRDLIRKRLEHHRRGARGRRSETG